MKIIAGNWKMNGSHQFVSGIASQLSKLAPTKNQVIIFPPSPYISSLRAQLSSSISIGAQNITHIKTKAATGEISPEILNDIGASFALIGHSERRTYFAESEEHLYTKAVMCREHQITPLICIGEQLAEREAGQTLGVLSTQLEMVKKAPLASQLFIAYEPVWAIGTGMTPSSEEIENVHRYIHTELQQYQSVKVLYGGSVNLANHQEILSLPSVDGALIGGASLQISDFVQICQFAQ